VCHTYRHLNELEAVYKLCDYTITCPQCRNRTVIDAALPSIDYCKCSHKTHCIEKGMLMFRCSIIGLLDLENSDGTGDSSERVIQACLQMYEGC
jgi:hypothetical protein